MPRRDERVHRAVDDRAHAGIDRRTIIRRAAVVGAAAWTAPVIIDSLASPAGAVTMMCTYTAWDLTSGCQFQKSTSAQDCVPVQPPDCGLATTYPGPTQLCSDQGGIVISCPTPTSLRLTIPSGCSCVFVAGAAKGTGTGACATGVISLAGKQMDFSWPGAAAARVSFYISC